MLAELEMFFFLSLRFRNWSPTIICSTQLARENSATKAVLIYVDLHSLFLLFTCLFHDENIRATLWFVWRRKPHRFSRFSLHQQHHKVVLHFIDHWNTLFWVPKYFAGKSSSIKLNLPSAGRRLNFHSLGQCWKCGSKHKIERKFKA